MMPTTIPEIETPTPAPPTPLPDPAALEREAESARTRLEGAHRRVRSRLGDVGAIEAEAAKLRAEGATALFGTEPGTYVVKQARGALGALSEFTLALAGARGVEARQLAALAGLRASLDRARADPEAPPALLELELERFDAMRERLGRAELAHTALHAAVEKAARVEGAFHAAAGRLRLAAARIVPELIAEAAGRTIGHVRALVARSRGGVEAAEQELLALMADSAPEFGPLVVGRVTWSGMDALDGLSVSVVGS